MTVISLIGSIILISYGVVALFKRDLYWRLYVSSSKMVGFKPSAFERTSAWDIQTVIQGLMFLILGFYALGKALF